MLSKAKRVAEVTGIDRVKRGRVDNVTLLLGEDFTLPPQFALPPTPDSIPNADI
jgi:hypothetical protein